MLEIRPIKAADMPILLEAYKKLSTDSDKIKASYRFLRTVNIALFGPYPSAFAWVADDSGVVVGCTLVHLMESEFELPSTSLMCDSTYVRSKYRKQGIAKLLWEKVQELIINLDIKRVRVTLLPNFKEYNESLLALADFKESYVVYEWCNYKEGEV